MTLQVALQHQFPGFALEVDFAAPSGVTVIFGRSGSGKTTVINAVAGLLRPDRGKVTAGGVVLLETEAGVNLPPHRRRIGYVFQDARLFPHLTVRQNLLYGRWFAPGGLGPDFDRVVDLLGIAPLLSRRPGALSGGEKQRVAIGRAILSNPRLLALDEPLAALDEARKAEILPYLERLRDELGLPILYVSHSVAEVARLATTLVVMEAGRIVAAGPAATLFSDPATAPFLGAREAGALIRARVVEHDADGLTRLETAAGPIFLPRLDALPGDEVRVRIMAHEVILSRACPTGLSAQNILPATILDLLPGEDGAILVQMALGPERVLAQVTRRAVAALELGPGQSVHVILKSMAVTRDQIATGVVPSH